MQYVNEHGHTRGLPWLYEQEKYQQETYGVDFTEFDDDPDKLTAYTTMNLNAAFLELAEAQAETPWKPWAQVDKDEVWNRNRDRFVGEVVDVLFFLANALVAVGCTDQELAERYAEKMTINRNRQVDGYDGFSSKCPSCHRALDEGDQEKQVTFGVTVYCSEDCFTGSVETETVVALDDDGGDLQAVAA
jgi:hypothetical protein